MKVAISACLLGVKCRYDGKSKPNDAVRAFADRPDVDVVRICPEVAGGLSIPHPANEQQRTDGQTRVVDCTGADNTEAFQRGATACCEKALQAGCTHAILKAKSPSCGVGLIYDGTFTGSLIEGSGVAAQALMDAGVIAATEATFEEVFGV